MSPSIQQIFQQIDLLSLPEQIQILKYLEIILKLTAVLRDRGKLKLTIV